MTRKNRWNTAEGKIISVRLPTHEALKIKDEAAREGKTISKYLNVILVEEINRRMNPCIKG